MAYQGIYKVIPSGVTESGQLRATLMLSPTMSKSELANMPSRLVTNWRDTRKWQMPLRVFSVWVNGESCVVPSAAQLEEKAITCEALAHSGHEAWGTKEKEKDKPDWLDALWTSSMVRKEKKLPEGSRPPDVPAEVWAKLAALLKSSNDGSGLQAGSGLCKAPSPEGTATPAQAASQAKPADASTTHVQTILPSRQSDLALLLESERALEICATARWARGDYVSCNAEEEACRLKLETSTSPFPSGASGADTPKEYVDPTDADHKMLRDQAQARFDAAQKSVLHLYDCQPDPDPRPAPAPWLIEPATVVAGREAVTDKISGAARSHRDANQVEAGKKHEDENQDKETEKDRELASSVAQRYFAIQGSPALSRLFGLTVDLEIDPKKLNKALELEEKKANDPSTVVHLLLGVTADDCGSTPVFTLVRYRPAGDKHFMPASRLELHWVDKTSFHPQTSQHEGVLVLGQELATANQKKLNRFVLTSLDVPRATNGALDRIGVPPTKESNTHMFAVEQAKKNGTKVPADSKEPLLASKPTRWARKTHSTAGLVLLDRGRAEQSLQQFAARTVHGKQTEYILLDSNDLLIGYRLDVGVPFGKNASCDFAWRSLTGRNIQHGNGGLHADKVAKQVPLLMGGSAQQISPWQRTLDDAQLSLPARLVDSAEPKESNSKDAYVEEVVAVWTGEPMSALCAAKEQDKEGEAEVGAGEIISLPKPDDKSDRLPPPLRFGWPYRVGVRAVYAGGISLPVQHAKRLYDGRSACTSANSLALPARDEGKTSGVRRFLRHERISAPFLLMHEDIAKRASKKMGYERSAHAIVRSVPGKSESDYAQPTETRRIFVPPSVEMHFAAMHGVFDGTGPKEALPYMRFDAAKGGFPCITAKSVEGINGETFYGERSISFDREARGDAVYIEKTVKRERPYFPDPAAGRWAIAVRHAGTNSYLEGPAVTVPMRKSIENYPDCRPLVLRVVRETSTRPHSAFPTLQQVLSVSAGTSSHARDGVEVVVKLAPGEDFDVDVWCVPEADDLQELFAPVESIAALALLRANSPDPLPQTNLMIALEAMLPPAMVDIVLQNLKTCGCWPDKMLTLPFNDGIGGYAAPGREIRKAIAAALFETMGMRPIDEIAAVQSLRVTHVTRQPMRAPAFEPIESKRKLGARRALQAASPETALENAAAPMLASNASTGNTAGDGTEPGDKNEKVTPGIVEYFLSGEVHVDLVSTGAIEFRALVTCPTTSAFDDPRRGRSARDRRNSIWPKTEQNSKQVDLPAEAVFGFEVCSDGKVKLPMREVTLLQVEDLAQPTPSLPAPYPDGLWRLHMENLTAGQSCAAWGRVESRHVFPDRKARRLRVRMIPRTRHEELMRTASATAQFGKWLTPGEDPQAPKDPTDDAAQEIWLDAGIRPSEPVAKTPIPAFDWSDLGIEIHRKTVIRIPLGRGWFSSGEGERLGVVVWPPGLLDTAATVRFDGGRVQHRHQVPLPDFVDEDLGPGGKFVTRWGSDPTRPIDGNARRDPKLPGFLDPSAFRDVDVSTRSGKRFNVELVPQVLMPVRRDAAAPDAAEDESKNPPVTLAVSLVTYEPLFDIETEEWYVDVALDHAFEAQPFVRLGLVRYQRHAPPELQVSFPTVQWVQMLPERSAWVITEDQCKEKSTWLTVEGLGTVDARSTDGGYRSIGTRMTARLVTEYKNAAGLPCRRVGPMLKLEAAPNDDGVRAGPPYRGPRWKWTRSIDVDKAEDASKGMTDATHYVYIEEREAYLPATYAQEPVTAEVAAGKLDACEHAETGPRFAVRLPLRRPVPLKKK